MSNLDIKYNQVAQQLTAKGIVCVPEVVGTSIPAVKIRSFGLEESKAYVATVDTDIGVKLGAISGIIALDLDHNIDGIHSEVLKITGGSPAVKKGQKGATLFFRYNGEKTFAWKVGEDVSVEILSDGAKTTIPPSIHRKTKEPYVWLGKPLEEIDISTLPILPDDYLERISALFREVNKSHEKPKENFYSPSKTASVIEALEFIEACSYDTWIKIGMILKAKFGDKGFEIWDNWSKKSSKYNSEEVKGKWESFANIGELGLGTLFKLAMDNGFSLAPVESKGKFYNPRDALFDLESLKNSGGLIGDKLCIGGVTDKHFTLRRGEVTLVTGRSNSGKSEFIDHIVFNLINRLKYKVAYCSIENPPEIHIESFIQRYTGKSLLERSHEELVNANDKIHKNIFWLDHENRDQKLGDILTQMKELHKAVKLDLVVIDPYSRLVKTNQSEHLNAFDTINTLSTFAKVHKLHIFFVAHPKTMAPMYDRDTGKIIHRRVTHQDVSGGTVWHTNCDNLMVVSKDEQGETELHFEKIRRQQYNSGGTFKFAYDKQFRSFDIKKENSLNI